MPPDATPQFVHYLPIATTIVCLVFLVVLVRRAVPRQWPPHLLWWGIGVFFYGVGTLLESMITLSGNGPTLNRLWYLAGAILGGYPLATGTVYLLLQRKTAHLLTAISLVVVVVASVAVLITPLNLDVIERYRPSGNVIGWRWIRLMTPFINLYAAIFLVGGAFYSATRYAFPRSATSGAARDGMRAAGTFLIAIGGILPGVGGGMAKAGIVEALYIGEFVGIILIWAGYELCIRSTAQSHAESV